MLNQTIGNQASIEMIRCETAYSPDLLRESTPKRSPIIISKRRATSCKVSSPTESSREIIIREGVPLPLRKLRIFKIYKILTGHHQRDGLELNSKILLRQESKSLLQTKLLRPYWIRTRRTRTTNRQSAEIRWIKTKIIIRMMQRSSPIQHSHQLIIMSKTNI